MTGFWFVLGLMLVVGALYNIYPLAGVLVLTIALALVVFRYLIRSHRRMVSRVR